MIKYNKVNLNQVIKVVHAVCEYYAGSFFLGREVAKSSGQRKSDQLEKHKVQAKAYFSKSEGMEEKSYEARVEAFLKSEVKSDEHRYLYEFPDYFFNDIIARIPNLDKEPEVKFKKLKEILNRYDLQMNYLHNAYCRKFNEQHIIPFIKLGESYQDALLNAIRVLEKCPWPLFNDNLGAFFNPKYPTEYVLVLLKLFSSIPHEGIKKFLCQKLAVYISFVKFNALARTVMNGLHVLFALSIANSYQLLVKTFFVVSVAIGIGYYGLAKNFEGKDITNFIINKLLPLIYAVSIIGAFIKICDFFLLMN